MMYRTSASMCVPFAENALEPPLKQMARAPIESSAYSLGRLDQQVIVVGRARLVTSPNFKFGSVATCYAHIVMH